MELMPSFFHTSMQIYSSNELEMISFFWAAWPIRDQQLLFAMQPDYNYQPCHFLSLHSTPSLWGNAVQKLTVNFVSSSGKIVYTLEKEDRALMNFDTDWSYRRIWKIFILHFLEWSSLS